MKTSTLFSILIITISIFASAALRHVSAQPTQSDIEFLKSYVAETETEIPTTIGNVKFHGVLGACPQVCEYKSSELYVWLVGSTPQLGAKDRTREAIALKPRMVAEYCKSGLPQRNISLLIDIRKKGNVDPFDQWVKPADCTPNSNSGQINLSQNPSSQESTAQFLNNWTAQVNAGFPKTIGEVVLTKATSWCPAGCQAKSDSYHIRIRGWTPRLTDKTNPRRTDQAKAMKPFLLAEYCDSGANAWNIRVLTSTYDRTEKSTYYYWIEPEDCSINMTTGESAKTPVNDQSDVQYLNSWAADVSVGLPEMIGEFQLTNALSRCPAGCQETDSSNYLLLLFNTSRYAKQNVTIQQLESSLKPLLYDVYCKSEGKARNMRLAVFVQDMYKQLVGSFWVNPGECAAYNSSIINRHFIDRNDLFAHLLGPVEINRAYKGE